MGEKPVTSFAQITSNVQLQSELKQIYGNVNNVELFVGLMGENHLPGSSLGQTEQAILAKQFEALRDGDRYFYENADPPSLINQLNNTTLAQIIERNTNLTNLQPDVFFFYSNIQGNASASRTTLNHDHQQTTLTPLVGATVELIQNGSVVATTTTDSQGNYNFNEVGAGKYTVEIVAPGKLFGKSATMNKNIDITEGQQAGQPAVVNAIFDLADGDPGNNQNPPGRGHWQPLPIHGSGPMFAGSGGNNS